MQSYAVMKVQLKNSGVTIQINTFELPSVFKIFLYFICHNARLYCSSKKLVD